SRIPGGSTGGSAIAIATGMAPGGLGTDTRASIRVPAALSGVVGFKPTFDLVSTDGCFPLAPSFDHIGPMARTVEDCERMLAVLAREFAPRALDDLRDARFGVAWAEHADPLVRERVEEAAGLLGAKPADFPFPTKTSPVFMREVADVHRELYAENAELYGEDVATKIERCLAVGEAEASAARRARDEYRRAAEQALAGFDVLATPTLASVAPPVGIGDAKLRERMIRFTYAFNALGWPALALPCGPAEEGLPASVQLVGKPGEDALVLAAGRLLASLVRVTPAAS
ncbi:MAG: amidase, partial [Gaiellaceae bacterium]